MSGAGKHEPTGPIDGRVERFEHRKYTTTMITVDRPCRPYVAADGQRARCEENRGGDFYTDCALCLTCDVPHIEAPDLMAYVEHPGEAHVHCVFTRKPTTPAEIERAIDAMCQSEVCGVRYGGIDPEILRRIAARRNELWRDSVDAVPPTA